MRRCAFCPNEIHGKDYFEQVVGWVASGKRDSLTLRSDTYRYAHPACIRLAQYKVLQGQGVLGG